MHGINPIQYSEIKSFFELIDIEPMEWEVVVIKQLDQVAMKAYNDSIRSRTNNKKSTKK